MANTIFGMCCGISLLTRSFLADLLTVLSAFTWNMNKSDAKPFPVPHCDLNYNKHMQLGNRSDG